MLYPWGEEVLSRVQRDLFTWLCRYVPAASAATLVSGPFMLMLRGGMNGQTTARGVYKELYQDAESAVRKFLHMHGKPMPAYIWREVPLPTEEYLCDLARCYTLLWQVTEVGEITTEEQDFLIEVYMAGGYTAEGRWIMHSPPADMGRVTRIFDRALAKSDAHQCNMDHDCDKFAELWRHEEYVHGNWYYHYAKSSHRRKLEFPQQADYSGWHSPQKSDNSI
jgi:hypothetical protein